MLRTRTWLAVVMVTTAGALVLPASAHAQSQSITFTIGGFIPKGFDGRSNDDVLVNELSQGVYSLLFDVDDFRGATFGADWLIGVGNYADAGVGIGYYSHTVPSVYAQRVHPSGAEIQQDLRLRITPVTASVRLYPMGRFKGLQPFLGGGFSWLMFRFSETGEFVDPAADDEIFQARYSHNGTEIAPIFLGGLRSTIGDRMLIGGEVRYQWGQGDLPTSGDNAFIAPKIDLAGWITNFTLGVRF